MKALEVRNFKHFVVMAAKQYNTTVQQVQKIVEELDCTVFVQERTMYSKSYNYALITCEDMKRVLDALKSRKDSLQKPEEVQKRKQVTKEAKLEWLKEQGATTEETDKPNVYKVSMYNGAIVKRFNLSCGMQNIQNYFAKCFQKN